MITYKKNTAIIILNYNHPQYSINCIESIERNNTASIKYILIDNGSTLHNNNKILSEYLSMKFPDEYSILDENDEAIYELTYITLLKCTHNEGYAIGNNKGLKLAYNDSSITSILILNNDVLFISDIIPELLKNLDETTAIVSPLLLTKDGISIDYNCAKKNITVAGIFFLFICFYFPFFNHYITDRQKILLGKNLSQIGHDKIKIDLPSGSCMLLRKNLLKQIGGFDPRTFLYFEENILYKKIEKMHLVNYVIPTLHCIHLGATSTKDVKEYFIVKSSVTSAKLYIDNYASNSNIVKFSFTVLRYIFLLTVKIQKYLKGLLN